MERSVTGANTYSGISDKEEALQEFAENEVYLIYDGEKLVASTQLERKGPSHVYLSGMVVHPDYQGRGIARKAAEFLLSKAGDAKRIDLVTHPDNFKVIKLWESLGFTFEKRVENYYGDGEPRIVMVREVKE